MGGRSDDVNYPINQTVLDVGEMNITGNVIPMNWFKWLVRTPKRDPDKPPPKRPHPPKPHTTAIMILADIVYWYRPTIVRDEETGQRVGAYKKFKADKLQRSRRYYVDLFGYSKNQVSEALKFLVQQGVITTELRQDIVTKRGTPLSNVMFIDLNVNRLKQITYAEKSERVSQKIREGIEKKQDTCTEITVTETSNTESKNGVTAPAPPTPEPTPSRSRKKSARDERMDGLVKAFCENSSLPPPPLNTDKQKKAAGALWFGPLSAMAAVCDNDVERTSRLMKFVIETMDGDGLTISSPNSIKKSAIAEQARRKRTNGKPQHQMGHRRNGTQAQEPIRRISAEKGERLRALLRADKERERAAAGAAG